MWSNKFGGLRFYTSVCAVEKLVKRRFGLDREKVKREIPSRCRCDSSGGTKLIGEMSWRDQDNTTGSGARPKEDSRITEYPISDYDLFTVKIDHHLVKTMGCYALNFNTCHMSENTRILDIVCLRRDSGPKVYRRTVQRPHTTLKHYQDTAFANAIQCCSTHLQTFAPITHQMIS